MRGRPSSTTTVRLIGGVAACVLFAVAIIACNGGDEDSAADDRALALDAKIQTLEESLAILSEENAALKSELAVLRQQQADFEEAQGAAEERLDDLEARVKDLENVASKLELAFPSKEDWANGKDEKVSLQGDDVLERTARLVEDAGGEVHYVNHPGRGDSAVLATPLEFVDGKTPLIVSLHGFGGNSADHSAYLPLHERMNSDGFALLLPNGAMDSSGNRFWNPTDECCEGGKTGEDDIAYLTELVAEARNVRDFGPVYFFGYSNGGFMSYHMACKGLPGLRAVASLAGTSYVADSSCDGASAVSVLHVHGTADSVIRFDGDVSEPDPKSNDKTAFYAGAEEMVARWSRRAGCDWPEDPQPYATLDLDQYVPGSEAAAYRGASGCAEGISVELWEGEGSGHTPAYGEAFVDALVAWLLAQD